MTVMPRPSILSVEPYVGGESKIPGVNRIVKLSSNEGAFGPPPGAIAAITGMAAEAHRYPDGGAKALREAIGARFGLDPARIVCGNGSDELLALLILAYGGEGTELVMSAHGFMMYDITGRWAGCQIIKVPERNLTVDVDASTLGELAAVVSVSCAWGNASSTTGALAAQSGDSLMRVQCAVPERSPLVGGGAGAASLEVAMLLGDGGRATSESGLAFWFEEPAVVVSAMPSAALAAAAVTVTVTGAGFRNTAALSCRVGRGGSGSGDASTAAVAASARWLSATAVECVLPARAVGNATLHVSNDGVVFSAAGARVEALAAAAPVTDAGVALGGTAVYRVRVLRVEPSQGWPSASQQLVTVDVDASSLAKLAAVASVTCVWGNASTTAGAFAAQGGSSLMSVRCAVPEQSPLVGGGAGAVSLEVAVLLADGGSATSDSGLSFWFEEPVVVVSALPSAAPAAAGEPAGEQQQRIVRVWMPETAQ